LKNRDLFSGLFLAIVSFGACWLAYDLELGTARNPGPGFIPFGIALLLGLMSLYLIIKEIIDFIGKKKGDEEAKRLISKKSLLIIAILIGYGLFFNFLGFPLSTFLIMMLMLWPIGREKVTLALTVSILTAVSSYILFVTLFNLPLPMGFLWQVFGG